VLLCAYAGIDGAGCGVVVGGRVVVCDIGVIAGDSTYVCYV